MSKETLSITDNRTGKQYELPIQHGAIHAMDLRQIRVKEDDFGLMSYDPAYMNTAACQSRVTYIDGDKGILRYRGYPIEQLAESSTYLEVTYLLLKGELPNRAQLDAWRENIREKSIFREGVADSEKKLLEGFSRDAHALPMLISTVSSLSTYFPNAKKIDDATSRERQIARLISSVPFLAALAYRYRSGLPFVDPDDSLSYAGNFLRMMFKPANQEYRVHPVYERALDVLFMLHADHEQNCSTAAMRSVGSSRVDPYCAFAAALAALYGPLHGGANEAVLRMLEEIGTAGHVPGFIDEVKDRKRRLMGFGHRVYKSYDPRAKIIKRIAGEVLEVAGTDPLLEVARELERIALEDDFFGSRNLYPNVDFYTGIIYKAMGFPIEMFTVLFAIGRTVGWLSQWDEMLRDAEQKIARPRQVYLGPERRDYVEIDKRS